MIFLLPSSSLSVLGLLSNYTVLLVDSIVSIDINLLLFGNNEQWKK
jgi:hypothetical protein